MDGAPMRAKCARKSTMIHTGIYTPLLACVAEMYLVILPEGVSAPHDIALSDALMDSLLSYFSQVPNKLLIAFVLLCSGASVVSYPCF